MVNAFVIKVVKDVVSTEAFLTPYANYTWHGRGCLIHGGRDVNGLLCSVEI